MSRPKTFINAAEFNRPFILCSQAVRSYYDSRWREIDRDYWFADPDIRQLQRRVLSDEIKKLQPVTLDGSSTCLIPV